MKTLADLLDLVVTTLQTWPLCDSVQVMETHQYSNDQYALKVRVGLVGEGLLQVRLYRNHEHMDYAYQLVLAEPSVRWDNTEHFPSIASYPHHFHDASGRVEASPLSGDPTGDLPIVLELLAALLG